MKKSEEDLRLAKIIGKSIAAKRMASGLTQEQVAEFLGIGYEAVSRMERGVIIPTVSKLIQLAEIFDIPVDALLVESSDRVSDQARLLADALNGLSQSDRDFLVQTIRELAKRLNR
jgi:transcriptional regulator with XRE-family HTH domain